MTPDLNHEPLDALTAFRATRRRRPARRRCRRAVFVRPAPPSQLHPVAPWFVGGMVATSVFMLATGAIQWIAAVVALWAPLSAHRALAASAVDRPPPATPPCKRF